MFTTAYNNTIWLRNRIVERVRTKTDEDRGAAMVEYAFLFTLIVIVCLTAVAYLGTSTGGRTTDSANQIIAAN